MSRRTDLLIFAHIGDLHITTADTNNYRDLVAILEEIETNAAGMIDFVYLPGDNADNGRSDQYDLVATALERLSMPVYAISGDHDMEQGSLAALYAGLRTDRLPFAVSAGGVRCLFLDMCGSGAGGPDFRLGSSQIDWLRRELEQAAGRHLGCAVFMHTYPADLRGENETATVNALLTRPEVMLVDMGHTHYNEVANDGRTIFTATRSTGQVEEGPVGYSITTLDKGIVSWRFKRLGEPFPVVLITSPADRRLETDVAASPDGRKSLMIRAAILGRTAVARCRYRIDEGPWNPMANHGGDRYFQACVAWPEAAARVTVEATDAAGRTGREVVDIARGPAVTRIGDGSDADAIGAWPERDVLGTQLGPNRHGRHW